MKQFNRQTGASAEDIAAEHLAEKGYTILERNFQNKFGEIDIIAKDKDILVFVEVKAKIGDNFGLPEEMVGKGKLQRIKHMATIYTNGKEIECRTDVVAIVFDEDGSVSRLTHYENVV